MSAPESRPGPNRHLRRLLLCGVSLLALAGLSFGLSYLQLGSWALPMALAIAALKAGLVLTAFMEFNHQSASVKLGAALAVLMLALLLGLLLADIATREPAPLPAPLGLEAG
ncbi:MAG: cytochrome C oxidase subunit IV family protein [Polyangiaceae bacterium]